MSLARLSVADLVRGATGQLQSAASDDDLPPGFRLISRGTPAAAPPVADDDLPPGFKLISRGNAASQVAAGSSYQVGPHTGGILVPTANANDSNPPSPAPPQDRPVGPVEDVLRSIGTGAVRGIAGVTSLPSMLMDWADAGVKAAGPLVGLQPAPDGQGPVGFGSEMFRRATSPENIQNAVEGKVLGPIIGPLHEPDGPAERFAETVGEFLPGALTGGGSVAGRVAKYALAPAAGSEIAGNVFQGSPLEGAARAAGGLVGGAGGAWLGRANTAEKTIRKAFSDIDPAQRGAIIDAADALRQEAARQGIDLTMAEAVQQVSGGATRLGDAQRLVESNGRLRPYFADRPDQIDRAARAQFDQITPPTNDPSMIGPAAGRAAEQEIAATQAGINQATRPLYTQAASQRVGQQVHDALMGEPLYARTLEEVRGNPALNRTIASLAKVTKEWVLRQLKRNAERSMEAEAVLDREGNPTGQYRYDGHAANKALELIGRELGMFVNRTEGVVTVRDVSAEPMTEEEWERAYCKEERLQ